MTKSRKTAWSGKEPSVIPASELVAPLGQARLAGLGRCRSRRPPSRSGVAHGALHHAVPHPGRTVDGMVGVQVAEREN